MEAGWLGNRAGSVAEIIFVMLLHEAQAPCQARQAGQRKRHAKIKFQHDIFEILSRYMHLFMLFFYKSSFGRHLVWISFPCVHAHRQDTARMPGWRASMVIT